LGTLLGFDLNETTLLAVVTCGVALGSIAFLFRLLAKRLWRVEIDSKELVGIVAALSVLLIGTSFRKSGYFGMISGGGLFLLGFTLIKIISARRSGGGKA
jgi:hypothetical protein